MRGTVCPAERTKRSEKVRQGRSTSQRMAPESRVPRTKWTFEREPPGWPDWR